MTRRAAILAAALVLAGCKERSERYEHAAEHPPGHDHHEEGHGHGGVPMVRITEWSPRFELFAEHPPAIAGREVSLLAHVTVLDGFRPLGKAELTLELAGPTPIRATSSKEVRRGTFELSFTPTTPGEYRGRLIIGGDTSGEIDGILLRVYADDEEAKGAGHHEEDEGLVELLKEQQWGVPFGTAFAGEGTIVASIQVAGTVETPPGGSAEVGPPVAGRVVAPAKGLPRPGDSVRKGQVLATLQPSPSSPEEAARASLSVAEAEARASAARAAAQRAERLFRDEAISQRELEDARREVKVSEAAVRAARRAAALFSGAMAGRGGGSWQLTAPIDGVLTEVRAMPGASVSPSDALFRIVDDRELWIRAQVPEQDAARLRSDRDAHYQVAGLSRWLPIDVTGEDATGSIVSVSRIVDPHSRTVGVIYALRRPDPALRVGGLVQVSLPVGDEFTGVVVPRTAIVEDEGRSAVFVQVDGEHFEERVVRVGPRSGELVGIEHGLRAGERIVSRGAHLVRLADRASSSEPHGHVH